MKIRSMISATPGRMLIQCDLSQAESWIVAFLAKEKNMQWSLQNSDIHVNTAEDFDNIPVGSTDPKEWKFGQKMLKRYTGKRCNHAFAYRMYEKMFMSIFNKDAVDMKIPPISLVTAKYYRKKWLARYQLESWWKVIENDLSVKRTLTTPYGTTRTFFAAWGQELFREATAHLPQRTVAEHFNGMVQNELGIEGGVLKLWEYWKEQRNVEIDFINQSHDSCIVDIHPSLKDEYIETVLKYIKRPLVIHGETFTIPVSVEIGERWGELKEIKV